MEIRFALRCKVVPVKFLGLAKESSHRGAHVAGLNESYVCWAVLPRDRKVVLTTRGQNSTFETDVRGALSARLFLVDKALKEEKERKDRSKV